MNQQQLEIKPYQRTEYSFQFWHRQLSKLLSLNSADLCNYIKSQADRNPCLEIEVTESTYAIEDFTDFTQLIADKKSEDFRQDLELQLFIAKGGVTPLEKYLIASLDNHGYCRENLQELTMVFDVKPDAVKHALRQLQSLEPAGIGARNLRECFLLQLLRKGLRGSDAWRLLFEAFKPLSYGNDREVLALLDWTEKRLATARDVLSKLNPYPIVTADDTAIPIIPDAEIVRNEDGTFTVKLLEHALPKLTVSPAYLESLSVPFSKKRFSQDGIFYAKRFLYCLEQRNQTLLKVLQFAVDRQQCFLLGGNRQICRLRDAADFLKLHPSTITHAVQGKYLVWGRRILPAKDLFARTAVGYCSADELKDRLATMIKYENKEQPHSDQKLADMLSEQLNVAVSRRTVTKYRLQLGLAAAKGRVNHDKETNDL